MVCLLALGGKRIELSCHQSGLLTLRNVNLRFRLAPLAL